MSAAAAEPDDGRQPIALDLTLDSVMLDGSDEVPDWVPEDWQDIIGGRLNSLFETDIHTITGAIALGWRVVAALDDEAITIVSPDDSQRFHFAPGRRQRKDRIRKTVMRLGVPTRVLELAEADGDIWKLYDDHPERVVPIEVIRPASVEPVAEEAYLVETRPMLAKSRKGRGYESKIAIERTWSDGTTDYKCILCDFARTNRLSMRGHWQRHINSGEALAMGGPGPGETFQTEVPNAATYMPRQHRIDALAELLAKMLEDEDFDPDDLALAALKWVHEQSKHGTGLAVEHEDLTDTERLHRIRLLLGMPDPQVVAQLTNENTSLRADLAAAQERFETFEAEAIEELTKAKDELTAYDKTLIDLGAKIETVTVERDRFRDRAARAQGDLQTLRELVQDLGKEDE